ncbi:MAG: CPBP family intramembrane metalloprotease [Gemmatimonadota bacterium]|nr:CPBP family intramembrane metalloprotease [Gemmatimonadota bacterium]
MIFALPLLLLYEALAALRPHGTLGDVRNGADVILRTAFTLVAGAYGPMLMLGIVIVASLVMVRRDMRKNGRAIRWSFFPLMAGESVVYALCFGVVVGTLTARLLSPHRMAMFDQVALDATTRLVVSLGAGLYEELLFRVILVSGLSWLARMVFGWRPLPAGIFATLVGAVVFSASHYIGQFGDKLELQSFVYRAIGGVAFSAMYLLRGFGITAWTHSLYDVFLLTLH